MQQANQTIRIDEENTEELLKGIKIPPQPQILADLHMEMAMPDYTIDSVAALIAKDVALSGYVLKAVNAFSLEVEDKVGSIKQAIALLGLDSIMNIVNAVSLQSSLSDSEVKTLTAFWDNARDVAETSALISRKLNVGNPDELYVLGLFHNAGIPLLLAKHENYLETAARAYSAEDRSVTDVENSEIHSNHSVVGYYVAKSRKLPDAICSAISQHHKVGTVLADEHEPMDKKNMLAILKLAGHLCGTAHTMGADQDYEFARIGKQVLQHLSLTELDVDDLRDDLMDKGIFAG